jgi:AI-2 transport protein TqsA
MITPDEQTLRKIQTICLVVLAVAAATFMIYWLRPVLVPLVVALIVVSGLSPILNRLEKSLGVTRIVAAGIAFLAGLLILLAFGFSLRMSLLELRKHSEKYSQRVNEIVAEVESKLPKSLRSKAAEVEATVAQPSSSDDKAQKLVDGFVRSGITSISQTLVSLVSTSVVVLIYVFFLLLGTTSDMKLDPTMREIDYQVRSFLTMKTVISIFTGFAFGLTLRLFGVPMAFTFGVLAFLLNFVPNVGPLVASLLPIPLIILDPDHGIVWMTAVISVTIAIQMISGNIVEPKVMGNSSDLHPVTILVSLMFWGMMWGIVGMFLATPIAAGFKIVLERIDTTKPIANLMAGRTTNSTEQTAVT